MINETVVKAVSKEIADGFIGDEMNLLHSIGNEQGVKAEELIPVYNVLFQINAVDSKWGWTRQEDSALTTFVTLMQTSMKKLDVYALFGELVNRKAGAVQQRYSKIKRKEEERAAKRAVAQTLPAEQTVQNIEVVANEVEHKAPKTSHAILESLEDKKKEMNTFFDNLSVALQSALETEESVSENALVKENRQLTSKVDDLEFQLEEAYKVIKNLQKQVAKEKETSNGLREQVWNLNRANQSENSRQSNSKQYQVQGGLLVSVK